MTKSSTKAPTPLRALFEIGTEELPATNLADLFENAAESGSNPLAQKLAKLLEERRIASGAVKVWATPRRLVFLVENIAPAQAAKDNLTRLLTKAESYGPDGQPNEKLLGILKHRDARAEETVIAEAQGKEYVFIKRAEPVKKTAEVFPEICETLVKTLGFSKNMKWDETGLVFPRPIRNYLCFVGAKALKFKIGRTQVQPKTVFFLKARRRVVSVASIPGYFATLKKNGVILDSAERKAAIQKDLEGLAKSMGVKLYDDPFLLSEVTFLVETPNALAAPFESEFLNLPLEVLTVSMARKQRIFGVIGKDGKVAPQFLAVLDRPASAKEKKAISKNIEMILRAKLQDSLFFYREDTKVPLEKKREELKNLVFLKGAGSMLEKSDRLVELAGVVSADLGLTEKEREALDRAAYLAKADLLTNMVGEFPELQGVMGRYYAAASGERAEVAEAIGDQYLPRTANDKLPASKAGKLLSVIDKMDLLAACFAMGLEPSSSLDPYGLRRSANAVLKILVNDKLPLSLNNALAQADKLVTQAYSKGWQKSEPDAAKRVGRLKAFFKDRFRALMTERGFQGELVDAVLATGFDRPTEAWKRLEALSRLAGTEEFIRCAKVIERTSNILKGVKEELPKTIDPARFTEELERGVFSRFQASGEGVRQAAEAGDYRRATSLYAETFFDILSEFFEKVFVNHEDPEIRKNRLALLKAVKDVYADRVADLSKIRTA